MGKKSFVLGIIIILMALNVACQNTQSTTTSSNKRNIKPNNAVYFHMKQQEKGRTYNIKLVPDQKISIETNYKGEIILLSPDGALLQKVSDGKKFYVCAKEGSYNIWIGNGQVSQEYYLIVKTYAKAQNRPDANEIPGINIDKDGIISGVIDSKTDAADYYYFQVKADQNLSIYYTSPDIKVSLVNKVGDENPCPENVKSNIFMVNADEIYLKVTPRDGAVGIQYEIELTRGK